MLPVIVALVFIALLVIQTTFFKMYGWTAPDASLITAVYMGIRYGRIRGYQIGIAVGLAQDIFSFGILGINVLSKGLTGMASGWIREHHVIDYQSPITWMILILSSTALNEFILQAYAAGFFDAEFTIFGFLGATFLQCIINLTAGMIFFFFMDMIFTRLKSILGIRDAI
ncbi:MAG: hypothetical protein IEMM0002_0242 [bacterium]|nr:MAG: hypothetical protein IEMM0002_0242 [bacterium]